MASLNSLRKKCKVVVIWMVLLIFGQVLLFSLLFSEINSVSRKDLSNKTRLLQRLKSNDPGIAEQVYQHRVILKKTTKHASMAVEGFSNSKTPLQSRIFNIPRLSRNKKLNNERKYINVSNNIIKFAKNTENTLGETIKKHAKEIESVKVERATGPDDILISVKTTKEFHHSRLEEIRNTWWTLTKRGTFLFTDHTDEASNLKFDGHLINTNCSSGHQRKNLCCKMGHELNFFQTKNNKRWFCHFDDDSYVIFPSLIKLLRQYNHSEPVYLGKPSLKSEMKEVKFWFGTGGAGFCLSQKLVSMMKPYFNGDTFMESCERIGLPDDCTVGFLSEYLLGVKMTVIDQFHSHLENLDTIPEQKLKHQVSLSHGYMGNQYNFIKIKGRFSEEKDPSRFKSLHCLLYPKTSWCS